MPPIVKPGGGGGAGTWSSSTIVTEALRRAPSTPQRACRELDGERLRGLDLGVLAERDLDQPRRRVAVAEAHRRRRRLEVAAGLGGPAAAWSP